MQRELRQLHGQLKQDLRFMQHNHRDNWRMFGQAQRQYNNQLNQAYQRTYGNPHDANFWGNFVQFQKQQFTDFSQQNDQLLRAQMGAVNDNLRTQREVRKLINW